MMVSNLLRSNLITSLFLFFVAFIPRVLALGRFLTPDEFLWVDRSRNFLAGLMNDAYQCDSVISAWQFTAHGLACTLRTGHPGVTTMWTGSFGFWLSWLPQRRTVSLYDYVVNASTNPLDPNLIVPERLGTVLIVSLWVVAVYWLGRRLFGGPIAFVAALLIALSPFHIALSRVIHHDALSTVFMTLSVLTAFIFWGQKASQRWLVVSGVWGGLAFMSKSPALYLLPFIAVVGLWFLIQDARSQSYPVSRRDLSPSKAKLGIVPPAFLPTQISDQLIHTVVDGLIWFAAFVVTVIIVWPAMWAVPLTAIETIFAYGNKYASGGHAKGNFFMGVISQDPGPLFYPVSWLYRTTPLVMLGLVLGLIGWPWVMLKRTDRTEQPQDPDSITSQAGGLHRFYSYLPLILIFIAGYILFMTFGEKKQERYLLPIYPWLDFIAAAGLVGVAYLGLSLPPIKALIHHSERKLYAALIPVVMIIVLNSYLIVTSFPYYFTYYNPVLGGIQGASKVLTIGWGEGLDLAADFFNHNLVSPETRVASWYESTFAPFFLGKSVSYSKEKGKVLSSDYVIFYINQTQRRFPDDAMFDFFTDRFDPVKVISLQGLDYVWIYPSLGIDHYVDDQTYTGIASLLAWQWSPSYAEFEPGRPVAFELYWEYLGKKPDEPFFVRLVDIQRRVWAEGVSQTPAANNRPVDEWQEGEIVYDRGELQLPPDIPPGQYHLQIGLYTQAPAVEEGELLFDLPWDEAVVNVGSNPALMPLRSTTPTLKPQLFGDATLFDAEWPDEPVAAGSRISLQLRWQVERPLPAASTVHVALVNEAGEVQQAWFNLTLSDIFNPGDVTWQMGDTLRTRWDLDLLPDVPSGHYHFELVLPDDPDQTLPFGEIEVVARLQR